MEQTVKRIAMYGLKACKDGPTKRNKVTTAMRNTTPEIRKMAVEYLLKNEYVTTESASVEGRGRSPLMVTITQKGLTHLEELEGDYALIHKTIWG